MAFKIVLVEPQIPPNTGNIGRLCIATKSELHLVEPLGFDITEKAVRRAGLDYWKHIQLHTHTSYTAFQASLPADARLFFFTKFAQTSLYQAQFQAGDYLVFGKETTGLPKEIHESTPADRLLRVPMPGQDIVRSLNLAGTVHIALYEALRQVNFES
jgi:tRNA (cytidine/uridine-2'-O-)-methyltransferase